MAILVTGAAGFIGFHVSQALLARGETVVGIDSINDYYDVNLKHARLAVLAEGPHATRFKFERLDICDAPGIDALFPRHDIDRVVHLAAQAGVRYSIENPRAYIESNIVGYFNVLEASRVARVSHFVYASSSSVYGNNKKVPYAVTDSVDHPVSLYAATKKADELMAHVYSHLHGLPTTGLRFFTVYGPWGRPDMSPFIFAKAIFAGEPVRLFNYGKHSRDFTYIDDIVEGVMRAFDKPPAGEEGSAPYAVYNIGNHRPVNLEDYVKIFERAIGKKANVELAPMQPGDVESTFADITDMQERFGYQPATPIESGVARFIDWYRNYYNV